MKKMLKKSDVLKEGYVAGLKKARGIVNKMINEGYNTGDIEGDLVNLCAEVLVDDTVNGGHAEAYDTEYDYIDALTNDTYQGAEKIAEMLNNTEEFGSLIVDFIEAHLNEIAELSKSQI